MTSLPRFWIRRSLTDGQAVVAVAHAALAWHLQYPLSEPPDPPPRWQPDAMQWVDEAAFEAAKNVAPRLVLTESTLDGAATVVVGNAAETRAPQRLPFVGAEALAPRPDLGLRMYVLVRRGLPLAATACAAANAVCATCTSYLDDEYMRLWLVGRFVKVVCNVQAVEIARALEEPKHAVVLRSTGDEVAAVAFAPRVSWPRRFRYFALLR